MRKVRIKKNPGDQYKYAAVGYGNKTVDTDSSPSKTLDTIKEVSKKEANVEAERGETVVADMNGNGMPNHFKVGGKKHSQGGTMLDLPTGSFIFSDDKKSKIKDEVAQKFFGKRKLKKGYTPAKIAKQYDLNKHQRTIEDPNASALEKRTAQMMLENNMKKLGELAMVQEEMKGYPNGIPQISAPYISELDAAAAGQQYAKKGGKVVMEEGGEYAEKVFNQYKDTDLFKDYLVNSTSQDPVGDFMTFIEQNPKSSIDDFLISGKIPQTQTNDMWEKLMQENPVAWRKFKEEAERRNINPDDYMGEMISKANDIHFSEILALTVADSNGELFPDNRTLFPNLSDDEFKNLSQKEIDERKSEFNKVYSFMRQPAANVALSESGDIPEGPSFSSRRADDEIWSWGNIFGEEGILGAYFEYKTGIRPRDILTKGFRKAQEDVRGYDNGDAGGAGALGSWDFNEDVQKKIQERGNDAYPYPYFPRPVKTSEEEVPEETPAEETPVKETPKKKATPAVEPEEEKSEINLVSKDQRKRDSAVGHSDANITDDRNVNKNPWFLQDTAAFMNEMTQGVNYYGPMLQQVTGQQIDGVMQDVSARVAGRQAIHNTSVDAFNQTARGSVARANILASSGQMAEGVAQDIAQVENANAQIANNTVAANAQLLERNIAANAAARNLYNSQTAQGRQNYDDSRRELGSRRLKAWMQGITNAQTVNHMLPALTDGQFRFNPVTGEAEFAQGKQMDAPVGMYAADANSGEVSVGAAAATAYADFVEGAKARGITDMEEIQQGYNAFMKSGALRNPNRGGNANYQRTMLNRQAMAQYLPYTGGF